MPPQEMSVFTKPIVKPPMIISEMSWRSGEVPKDCKKPNVTLAFKTDKKKDPGNSRPVIFSSIHARAMEQILLETASKHIRDKKGISSRQRGFVKGKSCLTSGQ